MSKENSIKIVGDMVNRNLPHILTGLGVVGVVATGVSAAKAAPKAKEKVDALDNPSKWEAACAAAPYYIPTVLIGGVSIACIIGADRVSTGRYLALASSYAVLQKQLPDETKNGVKKALGFKVDEESDDAEAKENGDAGKVLGDTTSKYKCIDKHTGMEFEASVAQLTAAAYAVSDELARLGNSSMGTFYANLGYDRFSEFDVLERMRFGSDYATGSFDYDISVELDEDGKPYIILDYDYTCSER